MRKRSLLCLILAVVMLLGIALPACKTKSPGETQYTVTFDVGGEAAAVGVSAPLTRGTVIRLSAGITVRLCGISAPTP